MWGRVVMTVAAVVVMVMVTPSVEGSTARPGLSWCSETDINNLKITKDMKPQLGQIKVMVNNTLKDNVVDEVFIRFEPSCLGITQAEVAHIDGEQAELILQDGEISLFWRPPDALPIFQKVNDFCITKDPENLEDPWATLLAKFCFPIASLQMEQDIENCSPHTCVRKCCPPRMSLGHGSMCSPVQDGEGWQPSIISSEPDQAHTSVHMLYGPPRACDNAFIYHNFSILPSGMVETDGVTVDVDSYCIDAYDDTSQAIALVCQKAASSWHCEWKYKVLRPVLLGISSVCLLIVWLVYVSVAKLRSNNDARCIISLVSALFVSFVILIIINSEALNGMPLICDVTGRLCHFALLASYFWMNVLSFHTFVRFRSQMDGKWEKPKVFGLYSLYAWGCPLVVMLLGVVLDNVEVNAVRTEINMFCWFYGSSAHWAYLYGPMLLLLVVNAGFFVGCVVLLSGRRDGVTFTSSSNQYRTLSVWLFVRLFILMGILWLTEVLSWFFLEYCSVPEWIIDIINSLQGVFVFLVTVCCRRDLKVFHCGRPQLIQKGRHSEITNTTEEASEMAANPLVS